MANQRYDLRKEPDGTVFEIATGQPVIVCGMPSTGLAMEEADDLVDFLHYRSSCARRIGQNHRPWAQAGR